MSPLSNVRRSVVAVTLTIAAMSISSGTSRRAARSHVQAAQRSLQLERAGHAHRVIAMSLYGTNADYHAGAIENARMVRQSWPDWSLRIYHDHRVTDHVLRALLDLGVDLRRRTLHADTGVKDASGMFWRFDVARDAAVTRFIIRDCDSRLTQRDKAAVDEWIASGRFFHVIRDHPDHAMAIMGGLWGSVGGFVPPNLLTNKNRGGPALYNDDQEHLQRHVWPLVRWHAIVHDAHYCFLDSLRGREGRPFPRRRLNMTDFVGNKYMSENGFHGLNATTPCPLPCRARESWEFC